MKSKRTVALIMAIFVCLTAFSGCYECKHQKYSNGVCEKCGVVCVHDYLNGVCSVCGQSCEHSFKNSVCEKCNTACAHTFINGVCAYCDKQCEHNFLNGACIVCDKPCVHDYNNGVCSICTKKCAHNFVNGFCSICDLACEHAFENGVCGVCNLICSHDFNDNSLCLICGETCKHDYLNGVCKDCDAEDPNYIPADGGASLYNEIVNKFKELAMYKLNYGVLPEINDKDKTFYTDAFYNILSYNDILVENLGYVYKDINGDGYAELMITEDSSRLFALFTIQNKEPILVRTFQNGLGYLMADGTVFYNLKIWDDNSVQVYLEYNISKLVNGELITFTYGHYDPDEDESTSNEVYFTVDESGVETTITKDEYNVYSRKYEDYWSSASRHTRLAGLRFNPIFPSAEPAIQIAAFFDYDLIIDTFTVMASVIAEDNYAKTSWGMGELDQLMIFLYDEDYYTYNKINAACVLLQKSTSPVFGYALKDLDKDGTEELLLLDNAYNLFAIFTTVGDRAVLLDSYTDWHTAFIDSNGLIHVQDKVFPGRTKDRKYSVYEVAGDKLALKSSIYITHDLTSVSGKANGWYKAVNGEMVEIEQTEYETLYQAFEGDLGTSKYNEYNQANAGLTFVSVMQEN